MEKQIPILILLCGLASNVVAAEDLPTLDENSVSLGAPSRDEFIKPSGYSEESDRRLSNRAREVAKESETKKASKIARKYGPPRRKPASVGPAVKVPVQKAKAKAKPKAH